MKEVVKDFGFQHVEVEIPKQEEFYKLPRRFGSVPVDEAILTPKKTGHASSTNINFNNSRLISKLFRILNLGF